MQEEELVLSKLAKRLERLSKIMHMVVESKTPKDPELSYPSLEAMLHQLKELEGPLLTTKRVVEDYQKEHSEHRRGSIMKIDANPMLFPTPQACKYKTPEGRREIEAMSKTKLDHFFFENSEPLTKAIRKEIEMCLMRRFRSLPSAVIGRIMQLNNFKLSACVFNIEAWKAAGYPLKFHWIAHGKERAQLHRMIYEHELEQMKKGRQSLQLEKSSFETSMSIPLILELQYLYVVKQQQQSVKEADKSRKIAN
jgi:hypothetical protein